MGVIAGKTTIGYEALNTQVAEYGGVNIPIIGGLSWFVILAFILVFIKSGAFAGFVGKTTAPAADGQPYEKGER